MSDPRRVNEQSSGLVTLLFTALKGSTEVLSQAGDEEAQRIFVAHHDLLTSAAAAHRGQEVKWLGDGLMVAFSSAADAVSCAIAMQRASRRPIQGKRLSIRVGLAAGEALRDVGDYFGTPVVVARRLCDRAEAGQILCSDLVAGLLSGRPGFAFTALGELALKGLSRPVATFEVQYEERVDAVAGDPPFVDREAELARLLAHWAEAAGGHGGLVVVAGDPGIGKTRLAQEVASRTERAGALVLWGRGYEGEWAPPYVPFVEALESHVSTADPEALRADLGPSGPPLAQLVPRVLEVLSDLPQPVRLPPEEERFRFLDAVAQFLLARSRRAPVLLVLDDLQWADRSTVAMLRHVARFAPEQRMLLLGLYRHVELDDTHPLTDALRAFRRESGYDHLRLQGLGPPATRDLLAAFGHEVDETGGADWRRQTDGNPFFVGELLRHLVEEGSLYKARDGRWTAGLPLGDVGIPTGVRDVVARRLSRLSASARKLLDSASAFEGPFRFEVVAEMAGLSDLDALDALDEAVADHLVESSGAGGRYAFTNTLVRQTIYHELTPSRQVRLHRRAAEALTHAVGAHRSPAEYAEIAVQYHRSVALAGAEAGVEPALAAADHAQATGGYDQAATFLRMGLEMLPEGDDRRGCLLGRLGIVLAWALAFDDAVAVAREAGDWIAEAEGKTAAAEYLSDAAFICAMAGGVVQSWDLARAGLSYAGARDLAWARLLSIDYERRAAEDPDHPGVPLDSGERREAARLLRAAGLDPLAPGPMEAIFDSRDEALTSTNLAVLIYWAGEYRRSVPLLEVEGEEATSLGRLARAARCHAFMAVCQAALGCLDEARESIGKAQALATRLGTPLLPILYAQDTLALALDEGWEELASLLAPLTASKHPALAWGLGNLYAMAARAAARLGRADSAFMFLGLVVPWLERAPAWTVGFPAMASNAAEVLWLFERRDHLEVVQRALREKVVAPDFRSPMVDGRLALARLSALSGRVGEAARWFAEARRTLEEQGARPLLAICDHDEALMYARRGASGDVEAARRLLQRARHAFDELGMTGWSHLLDPAGRHWGDRE